MPASDSFAQLARRLATGDADAASAVFDRFAGRLVALARSRLDGRLASRLDPEDVVQSVLRSFFVRCGQGEFTFHDPEKLWSLLAVLTLRKCHRQAEAHFAQKRDARLEVDADGSADSSVVEPGLSREPTPEEAMLLAEVVEEVMTRLGTPLKRRVFKLSLQGYSTAEIARELGYYERGVERIRGEVRTLLLDLTTA